MIEFDRSKLAELDPRTTAEILMMLSKDGDITSDEVRERTGFEPFDKPWSQMPRADGNRRPVDKLSKIADAQIDKGKKAEGRPQEKPGGDPAEDYPEPPESK